MDFVESAKKLASEREIVSLLSSLPAVPSTTKGAVESRLTLRVLKTRIGIDYKRGGKEIPAQEMVQLMAAHLWKRT
jgi:hypothetical protein